MLRDVVDVRLVGGHRLWLRFDDGVDGEVDLDEIIEFTGIFSPLRDPREFARVQVHPEWRTVCWPNGADLDPVVLYAAVTGKPIDHTSKTT